MRSRVVVAVLACAALTGCGSERSDIRTHCDGPNMVYEAWVDEPESIGMEFRELYVVAGDPRCAPPTPSPTTPSPVPSPSQSQPPSPAPS